MPACLSLRGLKSQPGRRARAQGWLQAAIDNYVISPHQVVDDRPLARPCNLLCNHHFPLLPLLCHTQGNGKTYINTRQIFAFCLFEKRTCPLISLSVLLNYCLWDCCHLLISSCHQWNYPWSLPLIALIQFSYYFDYYLCLLWLPFTESVLMFAVWDETLPRLAKPILWGLNWKRDWCGKSLLDPKSPQQWIFQVCQYERLVVCGTTLEEATQRGPGLVFVLPFLETATLVDIRVKVFEVWWFRWTVFLSGAANVKIFVFSGDQVPSQQILTTDSVTLTVDAVVYYRLSSSLFKEYFS